MAPEVGYIIYPILWILMWGISIFTIYNIIDYIQNKPPNTQTLLDKIYIDLFWVWIAQVTVLAIYMTAIEIEVRVWEVAMIVGSLLHATYILYPLYLFESCICRLLMILKPTFIDQFIENNILQCIRWTNLVTSFATPLIFYTANIESPTVKGMISGFDHSIFAMNSPEIILLNVLYGLGHISQIVSRLYLKFVKKIQNSNEIFTKYFVITICILDLSPIALVFLTDELSLKIAIYILSVATFILHPASMIIFHIALNLFFFSKYPKLKQFYESITEFLLICGICNSPPPPEDIPSLDSEEADPYSDRNLNAMTNQAASRISAAKLKLEQEKSQQAQSAHSSGLQPSALQPSQHLHPKEQTTKSNDSLPTYSKHRGCVLSDVEC